MLYSPNDNIDLRTSMNERTHFFVKLFFPHTLFSGGLMFLLCVRDGWRQTDCYIDPTSSLDHSSTSSTSYLGLLNMGSLRAISLILQAGPHSGLPLLTNSTATGTCLYSSITPTCFRFFSRLFALVHFLIDGLVKGQYTT